MTTARYLHQLHQPERRLTCLSHTQLLSMLAFGNTEQFSLWWMTPTYLYLLSFIITMITNFLSTIFEIAANSMNNDTLPEQITKSDF